MAYQSLKYTGTKGECDEYVARVLASYNPLGYGTSFNWPPEQAHPSDRRPIDHGDGTWAVFGSMMTSCD